MIEGEALDYPSVPLARIVGADDVTYGQDVEGRVWRRAVYVTYSYLHEWKRLPLPEGSRWISDLYMHLALPGDYSTSTKADLRVLTREGRIWEWSEQHDTWQAV